MLAIVCIKVTLSVSISLQMPILLKCLLHNKITHNCHNFDGITHLITQIFLRKAFLTSEIKLLNYHYKPCLYGSFISIDITIIATDLVVKYYIVLAYTRGYARRLVEIKLLNCVSLLKPQYTIFVRSRIVIYNAF